MLEHVQLYWVRSLQYRRGDTRFGSINLGEFLGEIADLAGTASNLRLSRLEHQASELLNLAIAGRKQPRGLKKQKSNVVKLVAAEPTKLTGRKIDLVIIDDILEQPIKRIQG